ncbi:MAG: UbiA family prenyltransferase [Patescibacteria group bacterium]
MGNLIQKIICYIESVPLNFKSWIGGFTAIIAVRLFVEALILGFPKRDLEDFLVLFLHTFLFFLLVYLVFVFLLTFFLKENIKKTSSVLLWGFWVIILPPLIDWAAFIAQGKEFKSFYIFDGAGGLVERFFLFFGEGLHWGITLGTRVEILLVLFLLFIYVYHKKASFKSSAGFVLLSYFIFYLFGVFPSLVVLLMSLLKGEGIWLVQDFNVASVFMSPFEFFGIKGEVWKAFLPRKLALFYTLLIFLTLFVYFYLSQKTKFKALLKNIRFPQMFFNGGLLFIGLGLGWFYYPERFGWDIFHFVGILNLILMVFCAWFFSVFINDIFDAEIDKISNPDRPLVSGIVKKREYMDYGLVFLFLSLIIALLFSPVIFLLIVFYHLLTWIYSAYPFRLKKFFGVANLISATASLLFLGIGFLVFSGGDLFSGISWEVIGFLGLAYFFVLSIKDLRDVEGDRREKIYTLPVLIGLRNAKLALASLILFFYLFSVYVFNENKLFPWAVLFGSVSFFVVAKKEIKVSWLYGWLFAGVLCYGLIGVWIMFT